MSRSRLPHSPHHSWVVAALLAIALSTIACGGSPTPATAANGNAAAAATVASEPPGYRLGIGDVLRVALWKDADLDVNVPIAPDGRIALPLLGQVQAAGRTLEELRVELTRAYAEYVTSPAVLVTLQEINSRKVFVTGEVNAPGVYELSDRMRLMQAIAVAGGLTPYARPGRVVVLRNDGERQQRYAIDLRRIVNGHPYENLRLQPGDTVIVAER